mgnify:FL=1
MAEKKGNRTPTTVEKLLGVCTRAPQEQLLRFKSWTDADGEPVVFRIRELSYNKVREIQDMNLGNNAGFTAAIITAGVVEPNLRDERLQKAVGAVTPYEVVYRMLRAGEVADLQAAIEKLSGYRGSTLQILAGIEKN